MIYLVERKDDVGWDEYDAFVVRAKNEEEAITICSEQAFFNKDNTTVKEINSKGKSGVILGSFNAG